MSISSCTVYKIDSLAATLCVKQLSVKKNKYCPTHSDPPLTIRLHYSCSTYIFAPISASSQILYLLQLKICFLLQITQLFQTTNSSCICEEIFYNLFHSYFLCFSSNMNPPFPDHILLLVCIASVFHCSLTLPKISSSIFIRTTVHA